MLKIFSFIDLYRDLKRRLINIISKVDLLEKSFRGSKKWANDLLRWFLREILYKETWVHHPYNKIIVSYDVISQLESFGFVWQAERVRNHLHLWMKKISCTRAALDPASVRARDTLDQREREVSL